MTTKSRVEVEPIGCTILVLFSVTDLSIFIKLELSGTCLFKVIDRWCIYIKWSSSNHDIVSVSMTVHTLNPLFISLLVWWRKSLGEKQLKDGCDIIVMLFIFAILKLEYPLLECFRKQLNQITEGILHSCRVWRSCKCYQKTDAWPCSDNFLMIKACHEKGNYTVGKRTFP